MATTEETVRTGFRDELVRHGLLIATGVPGVYGRSVEFEDTIERVDRLVTARGAGDRPEVMRFPPIINRAHFEKSGYLKSFPHLAGSIHSFAGNERAHRELLQAVESGRDWSAALPPAAVVLTPAACYPVYPVLAGTLASGRPARRRHVLLLPPRAVGRRRADADVPHARAHSRHRSGIRDGVAAEMDWPRGSS